MVNVNNLVKSSLAPSLLKGEAWGELIFSA